MGTRADFYIGRDENMEWLGSQAMDGYPDGVDEAILNAPNVYSYRGAVIAQEDKRGDWTTPDMGWPWPWDDSELTDYAYTFDDGRVWASTHGGWFPVVGVEAVDQALYKAICAARYAGEEAMETTLEAMRKSFGEAYDGARPPFPNMKDKQRVTMGPRSGVIVVGG